MQQYLNIQDPSDPNAPLLRDAIAVAAREATSGGGAFAFASQAGVELLLNDEDIQALLANGQFHLIVGTDEITDERALDTLASSAATYPNFRVQAFYNSSAPTPLFHPKFVWFRQADGVLTCIVGSGNLTGKGLAGNWEAFTVSAVSGADAIAVEETWKAWVERYPVALRALNDIDVRMRARQNSRRNQSRQTARLDVDDLGTEPTGNSVLIAEIPNNNLRWHQANVTQKLFLDYFEASLDQQINRQNKLVLWPVDSTGQRGPAEVRPPVRVASVNFRVELGAHAGAPYPPGDNRPIGVFAKIGKRQFNYRLLMPNEADYATVNARLRQLVPLVPGPRRLMRRSLLTWPDLHDLLPNFPSSGNAGE